MAKYLLQKKLNEEQLEAVKHKAGPILIIAGAGTGKTTVITERIKHLILSGAAKSSEILALTFTEKASREMEERIDIAMPYGYTQMWVMTFHSFCDRILRREALHIGLDPKYKLMTEAESIQVVRSNLFSFDLNYFRPLGNPNKFLSGMLQHFSRLQDEDVTPLDYLKWVKGQMSSYAKALEDKKLELEKWNELANAYRKYDEIKIKEGRMDFGDLITKTLKLFRERKNVLREYEEQFKYILIDEFQDTNYAQNELALLLSKKRGNITVVGDDDQSIYRFRGAAVSNIVQFRKNFPKAKIVVLTKNYRSTQEILDRSYDLIQGNNPDRLEVVEKIDKKLEAINKKTGEPIVFIHTDRVENEADLIAKKIKELVEAEKYEWRDFAILVRANNHSEPIGRALVRLGLPYQFLGPGRLFRQPEVIDLVSYLKVLNNFEDSVALYRIISLDYFEIPARDIASLGNYARKYRVSLFEACEKIDQVFVQDATREKIKKILGLINKHLKNIRKETAGQLLYYFLEDTGLLQVLINPKSLDAEKSATNISKFFDKLKTYEVDHQDATIPAVVDWLELSQELGESPLAADVDWGSVNAVNILTVHSAKGLEFPVVFLVNLVDRRFPTIERREQIPIPDELIKEVLPVGDFHLQEERRLFYVGMTRAKDLVFFTAADYYGEGKREKRLSPFIFESLGDKVIGSQQLATKSQQLSFLDYQAKTMPVEASAKVGEAPRVDYLSYSQIETFKICPLHYKLRYIYPIPTPPSAALSFGTSMHAALKEFYSSVMQAQKPTKKLILDCLEKVWIKEGFASKVHQEKFLEKGRGFLVNYLSKEFDKKRKTLLLEQSFTVPLKMNQESGIKNNGRPLKIGGKIDRIDDLGDGRIEIIDYKTGAPSTQRDVDNNLQLTFYSLAATIMNEMPFAKKPEEVILTLYYFEGDKKFSTTRTTEKLNGAIEEIYETREAIEKSDFTCSGHIFCQNCEFSIFCNEDGTSS